MPGTNPTETTKYQLRIMELEPEHYEVATCFLCGQFGKNVDWYWAFTPEKFRAYEVVFDVLKNIRDWLTPSDDLYDAAGTLAADVDPIADRVGSDDVEVICADCAHATPPDLRRRIRAYADLLDEAGYSAAYGPDSDYLADPSLRDRGIWVRRHVGYELALGPHG